MTHFDLFTGLGGFTLAAEAVGIETIGFSEVDPFACKILKQHWPLILNYGDIRNIATPPCAILLQADFLASHTPQPGSDSAKKDRKSTRLNSSH